MEKISPYLPDFLKPLEERKLRFYDITYGEVVSISEEVWKEVKLGSYRGEGVFAYHTNEYGGHDFIVGQLDSMASSAKYKIREYDRAIFEEKKKIVRPSTKRPSREEILRALGKIHLNLSSSMNNEEIFENLKELK